MPSYQFMWAETYRKVKSTDTFFGTTSQVTIMLPKFEGAVIWTKEMEQAMKAVWLKNIFHMTTS